MRLEIQWTGPLALPLLCFSFDCPWSFTLTYSVPLQLYNELGLFAAKHPVLRPAFDSVMTLWGAVSGVLPGSDRLFCGLWELTPSRPCRGKSDLLCV
jgi:hypothetical protein